MRIFALFNLKHGVTLEAYTKWARDTDLPTVNALPSIEVFRLFRTTGQLGSDSPAPYSFIEVLDVRDMDEFGTDVSEATIQAVAAQFQEMVDVVFVTTEEIVA